MRGMSHASRPGRRQPRSPSRRSRAASFAGVAGSEQRRLLAVLLRSALVGVASGCLLQLVALASGREGAGPWLVPAALVAGVGVALGLGRRTSDRIAARMLDRDLEFGAGVSTALELEQAGAVGALRALALSDGRAALGRSLSPVLGCSSRPGVASSRCSECSSWPCSRW